MAITPDEVKNEWRNAYLAANGKTPPQVKYESGWFTIYGSKYRKSKLIEMTNTLRERAIEHGRKSSASKQDNPTGQPKETTEDEG